MNKLLTPIFLVLVVLISGYVQETLARSIWNANVSEIVLSGRGNNGEHVLFEDTIQGRTALKKGRWPAGIVPYRIDNAFIEEEIEMIQIAMADIEKVSCIKFKSWTPEDKNYLFIRDLQHCVSYVGFQGGVQVLSLAIRFCMHHEIILHELMHALGFIHEHCRDDRDEYVEIQFDNIMPEFKYNFKKYMPEEIDHLDENYDYNSIMHYDQFAYAIDREKPTIIAKDPSANLNPKTNLSPADIRKLNKFYKC